MTRDNYIQYKTIIKNYTFDDSSNWYTFFKYAKRAGLRGVSFKQFCNTFKKLGVYSAVVRDGASVSRVLGYDSKADQYFSNVFPVYDTCVTCNGAGVVAVDVTS